jgi:hypothetical protein
MTDVTIHTALRYLNCRGNFVFRERQRIAQDGLPNVATSTRCTASTRVVERLRLLEGVAVVEQKAKRNSEVAGFLDCIGFGQ